MQRDFQPLFRNPHLLTIAANFWPRKIDTSRFPPIRKIYEIDPCTKVLGFEHQPEGIAIGQIVCLHGLESSADAGYMQSFAQSALVSGFGVHRLNMRTCGGTEDLCETMYHSGLTSDTLAILRDIRSRGVGPIFLVGFSLGGNVALKLAGELGQTNLLAGVCAISTPIELSVCVRATERLVNLLYARRFLDRLRSRVKRKSVLCPSLYKTDGLNKVRTIWEFDDRFTAQLFGFDTAANYYATQSAARYLDSIRIPTLAICAKDDPLVPFELYRHPVFQSNPALSLLVTEHGGHLGFLSKRKPRFWVDGVILNWMKSIVGATTVEGTNIERAASV